MTDTVDSVADVVLDQEENIDRFQNFTWFLSNFLTDYFGGSCHRFSLWIDYDIDQRIFHD